MVGVLACLSSYTAVYDGPGAAVIYRIGYVDRGNRSVRSPIYVFRGVVYVKSSSACRFSYIYGSHYSECVGFIVYVYGGIGLIGLYPGLGRGSYVIRHVLGQAK